jgi:hypothetical protein
VTSFSSSVTELIAFKRETKTKVEKKHYFSRQLKLLSKDTIIRKDICFQASFLLLRFTDPLNGCSQLETSEQVV